jgi:glutaredoxin
MRNRTTAGIVLSLICSIPAAGALTVAKCVDASGTVTFMDKCPPGTTKEGEQTIRGIGGIDKPTLEEIAAQNPIILYTVPDCDACDLVRNTLNTRKFPYTEKDVQDNSEMQDELKAATGGLTVPAMVIGTRVSTGYSRSAIDNVLEQAGYPEPVK